MPTITCRKAGLPFYVLTVLSLAVTGTAAVVFADEPAALSADLSIDQPPPAEMAKAAGVKLPSLPWHVANIWWDMEGPTPNFTSLEMDVTIDRDIPSSVNLYIAPVGVANINKMQFYGGMQTNINGWVSDEDHTRVFPGKGGIFSRWSNDKKTPIGLENVKTVGKDNLVESAGYEGEFASVRRPFPWTKGKYTYCIDKGETIQIDDKPHTWFVCSIKSADGARFEIGQLRFEGETFEFWDRHSAFVEVYSTAKIPRSNIPKVNVTFGWPRLNGQPAPVKRAHAFYPNKKPTGSPDCANIVADGSSCRVEVGPIFVRDEAKRRHDLAITRPE